MRYRESILEAILIERKLGKTYKEISDKLDISIYEIKRAVIHGEEPRKRKVRKNKNGNMDNE